MQGYEVDANVEAKPRGSRYEVSRQVPSAACFGPLELLGSSPPDGRGADIHALTLNRAINSRPSRAKQAMLQLQRQYGNRYVQQVLRLGRAREGQAEVKPGASAACTPHIAPELRRKCACGGESEEECAECRVNRLALQPEAMGGEPGLEAPSIVEDVLGNPGTSSAGSARTTLEPSFGHDFSQVRVHDDSKAAESASAVNALAYTVGSHIVFGKGQYAPATNDGNRLLAHELTHTIQQTGGAPLGSDLARLLRTRDGLVQRDPDTPGQTDPTPTAAPPSSVATPDDSGPVSMAPITVAGEPKDFEVEGGCDGLSLHGKTKGKFNGGKGSVANQAVAKGEGCNCGKGVQCIHVTGTLVTNYSVSVKISMPPIPSGLTACERGKVQDFLQNVLLPHEHDHETRFKTYNGQTKNPVDVTGCGQADVAKQVQAIQDAEDTARRAAAQSLSDAIDPFNRTVDCSDCQKQSAAPGAGQGAGGDTGIAAKRLSSGGSGDLEAPSIVADVLGTPGEPAQSVRRNLDPSLGHDFSHDRVLGNHIAFAKGQHAPGANLGNRLLADELTHTIQQGGGTPKAVQRFSWDDITSAVSGVGQELEQGAATVGSALTSGAQEAALAAANAIAGLFGGHVAVAPSGGIVITIDDVEIAEVEDETIVLPIGLPTVPLFNAGFGVGVFNIDVFAGTVLGDPSVTFAIGPVKLQNITLLLDPFGGTYSGTAQLYVGSAVSGSAQKATELRVEAAGVIPAEPPVPFVASGEVGTRAILRLVGKEGFTDSVSLTYSGGSFVFHNDVDVKLGAIAELDHEAFLRIEVEGVEICSVIWPKSSRRLGEKGIEIGLPLTVDSGPSGKLVKLGTPTASPIAPDSIPTDLQDEHEPTKCMSLKDLTEFLCKKGILPSTVCSIVAPGGPSGGGGGTGPSGGGGGAGPTSGPCGGSEDPTASWGDFHHYSKRTLVGPIRKGQDWADYDTNSQTEGRAATGVPDDVCYQATLKEADAAAYIPSGKWQDRSFFSIVWGKTVTARHFTAIADVPDEKYKVSTLDAKK